MEKVSPSNAGHDHQVDASKLFPLLADNYTCLQRHYRLGNFEGLIPLLEPPPLEPDPRYYFRLDHKKPDLEKDDPRPTVKFQQAIDDLKRLTIDLAKLPDSDKALILQCKCLIYEAKDYLLEVPTEFASDFLRYAEEFSEDVERVRQHARELNGAPFENKDDCARVIKLQLIAALCGINILYRQHDPNKHEIALAALDRLIRFISSVLPDEHTTRRDSLGLMGLAQYLNGRILSAIGSFDAARKAFHVSAEAYVNRIRQKETFYYKDRSLPEDQYREKVSVTLRRAALVTAFGDGQLSFVNSQVTRALESLTLARAALSLNSGKIYLNYVDVLYYACRRAQHSSNRKVIDDVIVKLGECRDRLQTLLEKPHYVHRTGIQLALAHYYRARLVDQNDHVDFDLGMNYLDQAINFAEGRTDDRVHAPILSEALTIKSRFFRSLYRKYKKNDPGLAWRHLKEAEKHANNACAAGVGLKVIAAEAHVARADVYKDLIEFNRYRPKGHSTFRSDFKMAMAEYELALSLNNSENRRVEGLCWLRLAKLCLLDPSSHSLARKYFDHWLEVEPEVEHEYCRSMARDLESRLDEQRLLIEPARSLDYADWNKQVLELLVDEAIKEVVQESHTKRRRLTSRAVANQIKKKLNFNSRDINQLTHEILDDDVLTDRVNNLLENPLRPEREKPAVLKSFVTQQQRRKLKPALDSFISHHGKEIRADPKRYTRERVNEMLVDHVRKELRCTTTDARRFLAGDQSGERVLDSLLK